MVQVVPPNPVGGPPWVNGTASTIVSSAVILMAAAVPGPA